MSSALDDDPQIIRYREIGIGTQDVGIGTRPALLVVDCQNAFTRGVLASERTDVALEAARAMLETAREVGVEIIHLHVVFDSTDEIGPVWRAKGSRLIECVRGNEGAAIDSRVAPAAGELVIEKSRASAFFGTGLHALLQEHGIDSLVVCGTSTSGCVRATVVDGAALDYLITVVADAVDDRDPNSHAATLVDLQAKYADVLSLDDAAQRLRTAVGASGTVRAVDDGAG